ncbi:DNA double strand break repair Rad50 ATPase, putative [Entamoeba histolytica KU27]|uniref:DNA double strand break repair Rad50 ATPase, putative n=1 Tax=Entamoeba histolytica KU27 TaxID=885311 RepID=M2S8Z6_ENTHI|nr:DNA double strand break repair Rad50 ATPase, putative [Entamoeba histolytica KU27]
MEDKIRVIEDVIREYEGEFDEEKTETLMKLISIMEEVHQKSEVVIPQKKVVYEAIENPNKETVSNFVAATFNEPFGVDIEKTMEEFERKKRSVEERMKMIEEMMRHNEVKEKIGKDGIKQIETTIQKIENKLIECLRKEIQKDRVKEEETTPKEEETIPKEEETIPKEEETTKIAVSQESDDKKSCKQKERTTKESDDKKGCEEEEKEVDKKFEKRIKEIKEEEKERRETYLEFKRKYEEHGKNKDYYLELKNPSSECENEIKIGVWMNQKNNSIMDEMDTYEGLNEANKKVKKEIIIEMEKEIEEIERMVNDMKNTKMELDSIKEEKKEVNKPIKIEGNNQRYVRPAHKVEDDEDNIKIEVNKKTETDRVFEQINWRKMEMGIQFKAIDKGKYYVMYARIKGMRDEDIDVNITKNGNLSISGMKIPNKEEKEMIMRMVNHQLRGISEEEKVQIIYQYCQGKYGRFKEIYSIPKNVDIKKIIVSYTEEGILQINLPKYIDFNEIYDPFAFIW